MKLCLITLNMWSRILQTLSILIIINNSSVYSLTYTYTKESQAVTGEWCLNDCIDGECLVDIDTVQKCNPTDRSAPTFFTTGQTYTNYYKCTSQCKTLKGDNRPRCYVDHDWTKLDYCNPHFTDYFDLRDFSKNGVPCWTHCNPKSNNTKTEGQCFDDNHYLRDCIVGKHLYETVFTITGQLCNGECLRKGDTSYSWCYHDGNSWFGWDYCARPALYEKTCEECKSLTVRNMDNETVTAYAERMERDPRFTTVSVDDPHLNNPVYKYTYNEIKLRDGNVVKLPLVVRAVIKSANVKPKNDIGTLSEEEKKNCHRMGMAEKDVVGLLIANKLGGPKDFYNVVPMTFAANFGLVSGRMIDRPSKWLATQREIAHVVERYKGEVHLTLVLRYNLDDPDYPFRPVRIGWGRWDYASSSDPILSCPNNWLNNAYNSEDTECYN